VDQRLRRSGRRIDAEERRGEMPGVAGRPEGRNLGGKRRACVAIDGEAEDLAVADQLDEVADAEYRDLRGVGHHAVDRVAAAFERYANQVDAVLSVEVFDERRLGQRRG